MKTAAKEKKTEKCCSWCNCNCKLCGEIRIPLIALIVVNATAIMAEAMAMNQATLFESIEWARLSANIAILAATGFIAVRKYGHGMLGAAKNTVIVSLVNTVIFILPLIYTRMPGLFAQQQYLALAVLFAINILVNAFLFAIIGIVIGFVAKATETKSGPKTKKRKR